jgi:hypothetical protein
MTLIPDALEALIVYLKADADVAAQVSARVFGSELPRDEVSSMPRKAVVVRRSGGGGFGDASYLAVGNPRFDVFNYGATPAEANEVQRATYAAMKSLARSVSNSTLLHDATLAGGAADLRLSTTDWPVSVEAWRILVSEIAVS